jgi:hypothetical protein
MATLKSKTVNAPLTPTDDKKRPEVEVKVPLIILGIHSNVPADAGLTDGHAWLTVSRDGVVTTYGLWPDSHPRIAAMKLDDPEKSDIRIGMEAGDISRSSRFYKLTSTQNILLEKKLKENVTWHYTYTCASWASTTASSVTKENVDADELFLTDTPRKLTETILKLEKARPTSIGNPKGIPDDANPSSSST